MKTITFATSNKGKAAWLERSLSVNGLAGWSVAIRPLDLVEIQSWELAEISLHKARQAYEIVQAPVLVMDGGLYIRELNSFPGPFGVYMINQMGVENIARLAGTLKDKNCAFQNVVTYMEAPDKHMQFFDTTGDLYTMTDQAWPHDHPQQWSPIWRVMVPSGMGFDKPLAAFSEADLHDYDKKCAEMQKNVTALDDFVQHLKKETRCP